MDDYLNERVTTQRKWYEQKANENKQQFVSYQTKIIILGAIIPVLVAFESVFPCLKEYSGPIAAVISAIIAVYAGLDKLNQPQPNWFNYRANEEAMKKEEWFHQYKAGPYRDLTENEANTLLVERIENIISSDIARVTNITDATATQPSGTQTQQDNSQVPDGKSSEHKPKKQ